MRSYPLVRFLDPYRLNVHFETVRRLADREIDFLILLALYCANPERTHL
jgi:hypothetical protein